MEEHRDLFRSCEKTEIRIDNETVEDVAYELDLDIGEYVGISRIIRTNNLPTEPLNYRNTTCNIRARGSSRE